MTDEDARISNVHAERHLLGAIFTDPSIAPAVLERTTDSLFHSPENRCVYNAIKKLVELGKPVHEMGVFRLIEQGGDADIVTLAELNRYIEHAATAQTWNQDVELMADKAVAKRVSDLGNAITTAIISGEAPRSVIDHAVTQLSRLNGSPVTGDSRFLDCSVSGDELLGKEIPEPRSLLGDGLLTEGSLMVLHGKPGLGKTWALLQLAVSLASGRAWFGLKTEKCRVGIVELEMHAYHLRERLKTLIECVGDHEVMAGIDFVTKPYLRGPVDLLDEDCRRGIASWCRRSGIKVLCFDALARCHVGMEKEMGKLVAALDLLREEAGVAIVLVHHERKGPTDKRRDAEDDDMDAARGGSELSAGVQGAVRFKIIGDMVMMKVHKVNIGPPVEPLMLKQNEQGVLCLTEARTPEQKGDVTRERLKGALLMATDGCTTQELCDSTGRAKSTVHSRCNELGAVYGKDKKWRLDPPTEQDIPF